MRNPGDKRVPAALIHSMQAHFRVLDDWDIWYTEEPRVKHILGTLYYNGQCSLNRKTKEACIYPCPRSVAMRRYVRHEILHIALVATRGRKWQEMLVQDLCKLLEQ